MLCAKKENSILSYSGLCFSQKIIGQKKTSTGKWNVQKSDLNRNRHVCKGLRFDFMNVSIYQKPFLNHLSIKVGSPISCA